ncbi:MAG TPA: hypothetical protein VGD46_09165 [Rhizobacter sp.]
MRRWLLLFLVVLMPLRAWAGDAISLHTASSQIAQVASAMPADCPMHAESSSMAGGQVVGLACNACDLCLPLAELAAVDIDARAPARHVMRAAPCAASLGVAPAPGLKPPIR